MKHGKKTYNRWITVVPYIGTWIETKRGTTTREIGNVVPYIGTWIETSEVIQRLYVFLVVPYIGTWIETLLKTKRIQLWLRRTLYRYVD